MSLNKPHRSHRTFTLALLLGVASAGLTLVSAPPAASKTAGHLRVTRSSTYLGSPATFTGAVPTALRKRPLVLQRRSGTTWVRVRSGESNRTGGFVITATPPLGTVTFRVSAPAVKVAGKKLAAVATPSVKLTTRKPSGRAEFPGLLTAGSLMSVQADFAPFSAGRSVLLQHRTGASWTTDRIIAEDATGHASTYLQTVAGTFTYRLVATAGGGLPQIVTASHTVVLTPMTPSGTITLVSHAPDGSLPNNSSVIEGGTSVSDDGSTVAYVSRATNLVPDDTNDLADVFVWDRATNETTRIAANSNFLSGHGYQVQPRLSGDGSVVVFDSEASDLVSGDTNNAEDVFAWRRDTNTVERISIGAGGTQGAPYQGSSQASISADGRYVAFTSDAGLSSPNTGSGALGGDIYLRDLQAGTITTVSQGGGGVGANNVSAEPSISADGRYVVFTSYASNLTSPRLTTGHTGNIYEYDRVTGSITLVTPTLTGLGASSADNASVSGDGRYVAYESLVDDLVDDDTNGTRDVFVWDRDTGLTTRISTAEDGAEGDGGSREPVVSSDGEYVVFSSLADDLVPGDTNGDWDPHPGFAGEDVFRWNRLTGDLTLIGVTPTGLIQNGNLSEPSVSGDGRYIAFRNDATNLAGGTAAKATAVLWDAGPPMRRLRGPTPLGQETISAKTGPVLHHRHSLVTPGAETRALGNLVPGSLP